MNTGKPTPDTEPDVTMAEMPLSGELVQDGKTINENTPHQPSQDVNTEMVNPVDNILTRDQDRKYKLCSEIAHGGMGRVMEAQDTNLHRSIAMKVMLDPNTASRQRILRFIEEARITSQLQHPGIVPIHELGIGRSGNVFYTMKRISGKTLREILKELKEGNAEIISKYPLNRLLNILMRVSDAIAYAHSMGVVHRDLKPDNIMIGDYGEVLVLDWGLAKVIGHGEHGNAAVSDAKGLQEPPGVKGHFHNNDSDSDDVLETMEGKIIGTPGYMSPEQARGQIGRIDERSDVYSLGAILYHMLKLESTVGISTTVDRKAALEIIREGRIEPLKETRHVTKPLIAITMKALSLRPKDRYRTVKSFQADLDAYMEGFVTKAEELSIRRLATTFLLRHKVISLFSIALLGLLIAGLLTNYQERLKAERARGIAVKAETIAKEERKRTEEALTNLKATAPALISLVDYHVQRQEIWEAMKIVNQATDLVPESPECHIKRGNLLQILHRFKEASVEYETALKLIPSNKTASINLVLCCQMLKSKDVQTLSEALWEQERYAEACHIIQSTAAKQKPKMIRFLIKWVLDNEKIQYKVIMTDNGICSLDLSNSNIADLSPLKTLPLTHLNLTNCRNIYDLRSLKDIPLKVLDLTGTDIADLRPLNGMRLKELLLNGCYRIVDITPLKGMPLTRLELGDCLNIENISVLKKMKLTRLNLSRQGNSATRFDTENQAITLDLSVLKDMPLKELDLTGCTEITDLVFLKGKHLTDLKLGGCDKIKDLSPLQGMPLQHLDITDCTNITDLSRLKDMKLSSFEFRGCIGIKDYSLLRMMPVARFLGQ